MAGLVKAGFGRGGKVQRRNSKTTSLGKWHLGGGQDIWVCWGEGYSRKERMPTRDETQEKNKLRDPKRRPESVK